MVLTMPSAENAIGALGLPDQTKIEDVMGACNCSEEHAMRLLQVSSSISQYERISRLKL